MRYKRDHSALMQLQDQTTKLIVASLYDMKQGLERSSASSAGLDKFFDSAPGSSSSGGKGEGTWESFAEEMRVLWCQS